VTTEPLKEPLRLQAALYHDHIWLCNVKCSLSPADAPVRGIAQVFDDIDWLSLNSLTLALHSGERYQITPLRLDPASSTSNLLMFEIAP
jgi:hypothetical protein